MSNGNNDDMLDAFRHAMEQTVFGYLSVPVVDLSIVKLEFMYEDADELTTHVSAVDEPSVLEMYLDFHLGLLSKAMGSGSEGDITIQKEQLARIHVRLQELGWTPSRSR